jgi:hypothetical protein
MKKLTIISILLFALNSYAQDLPDFKVPKTYKKVLVVKGDLDKDGIPEIVYAYNTDQQIISKDDDPALGFERELYICKNIGGKIKLWKKNKTILWKSKDCGFYAEDGVQARIKIANNTLIIEQMYHGDSKNWINYKVIFRYQNSDWFLIGFTTTQGDDNSYEIQDDINYSTKKIITTKKYMDTGDGKKLPQNESKTEPYHFKEMTKMDNFTIVKIVQY